MSELTPNLRGRHASKRRSIKTKILLTLLALSLLPLILLAVVTRSVMVDMRKSVKAELVRRAHEDLLRRAKAEAAIANAMLDKVEAETQMVAFFGEALLRNPLAFGHVRSYSATERPDDPQAASLYTLAPRIALVAAYPELDLTSNLDKLFALIKAEDPSVEEISYGTQSGIHRSYPWNNKTFNSVDFTLDLSFAQYLKAADAIPEPLLQAFRENGVTVSPHAAVSTADPGSNDWTIRDDENKRIFSVRQGKASLDFYAEYDPVTRPWYIGAVGLDDVAWTKYAAWAGGKFVFEIDPALESQIDGKVSPSLERIFDSHQITLVKNSPISIGLAGRWRLQDDDGSNYQIRKENGKLNVYSIDMLTCSRAVRDPTGRLVGVVGLDISMETISSKVIHTPEGVEGEAFLLNERGELIGQEKDDMFVPNPGGGIRSKMAAGEIGADYAAEDATYVAYSPIPSIHSADGKSFWSVGVSMPQAQIILFAESVQQRMVFMLAVFAGICAAMIIVVIVATLRMSKAITDPIMALGAGVTRIGSGDLDYRLEVKTGDEIEALADAFNKMADDVKTYIRNLRVTTAEKERFASELRVAHDIQMSFLKKIFPAFPHRHDFSLYATIETAREVGGDLYDFVLVDETRLVFYVGDVSDKGVPASLVMAMTMTLMKRAIEQPGITPAEILRQVNAALSEDNANCMFVTLFIGILDLQTGELSFSNAGHNPPLILGVDGKSRFVTLPYGLVLGVMTDAEYSDATARLEPGDMIVTYTDGVTEAMNPQRALYSNARLQETLATLAGRGVEEIVDGIVASVRAHAAGAPQSDDIAVVALRRS